MIIEVAREKIFDPYKLVSEIAYELGFKYPQYIQDCSNNVWGIPRVITGS